MSLRGFLQGEIYVLFTILGISSEVWKMGHEDGRTVLLSVLFCAIPPKLARIRLALLGSSCVELHMPLLAKALQTLGSASDLGKPAYCGSFPYITVVRIFQTFRSLRRGKLRNESESYLTQLTHRSFEEAKKNISCVLLTNHLIEALEESDNSSLLTLCNQLRKIAYIEVKVHFRCYDTVFTIFFS
jgi:hypothetical protein